LTGWKERILEIVVPTTKPSRRFIFTLALAPFAIEIQEGIMSPRQEPFPRGLLTEICPLLIAGLSDSEVAAELLVDEVAVSEYISWLLSTIGLANREELVLMLTGHFAPSPA
jgi:hypothetical protein